MTAVAVGRLTGLDKLRGAAVVLMVLDHVALVLLGNPFALRLVGRLSMPLFALTIGALAVKPLSSSRALHWAGALLAALLLYPLAGLPGPLLLLWLAAGRWAAVRLTKLQAGLVAAVALAVSANGYGMALPGEYDPIALVGLVLVGRLITALYLNDLGHRLPGQLARIGRYPLGVYIGHVGLLAGVQAVAG